MKQIPTIKTTKIIPIEWLNLVFFSIYIKIFDTIYGSPSL